MRTIRFCIYVLACFGVAYLGRDQLADWSEAVGLPVDPFYTPFLPGLAVLLMICSAEGRRFRRQQGLPPNQTLWQMSFGRWLDRPRPGHLAFVLAAVIFLAAGYGALRITAGWLWTPPLNIPDKNTKMIVVVSCVLTVGVIEVGLKRLWAAWRRRADRTVTASVPAKAGALTVVKDPDGRSS